VSAFDDRSDWDRLWTPHRIEYITGVHKPPTTDPNECPFCLIPLRDDRDGLIVHRGELAYVVLNLYPYNAGHLMVCPYRHFASYTDATPDETAEVAALTQQAMRTLTQVSQPQGFNLGINQERVAGAGIVAHLHQHIVPRWSGDANFITVIGGTKTMPQLLEESRDLLAAAWQEA
jgi:ATP adenylyltransferase